MKTFGLCLEGPIPPCRCPPNSRCSATRGIFSPDFNVHICAIPASYGDSCSGGYFCSGWSSLDARNLERITPPWSKTAAEGIDEGTGGAPGCRIYPDVPAATLAETDGMEARGTKE